MIHVLLDLATSGIYFYLFVYYCKICTNHFSFSVHTDNNTPIINNTFVTKNLKTEWTKSMNLPITQITQCFEALDLNRRNVKVHKNIHLILLKCYIII